MYSINVYTPAFIFDPQNKWAKEKKKRFLSPSWLLLSSSLYFFCSASSASSWAMRPCDSCLPSSWFSWISMRHFAISFLPVWLQGRQVWHHMVNRAMSTTRTAGVTAEQRQHCSITPPWSLVKWSKDIQKWYVGDEQIWGTLTDECTDHKSKLNAKLYQPIDEWLNQ